MDDLRSKNKRILKITLGVVVGMIALAFASVPIYRLTCQVTGWGGTTQVVAENVNKAVDRQILVKFNTNTARGMPWEFKPEIREAMVSVGADGFASFLATNPTPHPVTGTALFNVTPLKAGKYFYKTQCFCFDEQTLTPGQRVHMPVVFFIDPKIMDDKNMDDVSTITLSYTFFQTETPELEKAMEDFYNDTDNSKT